MVVWKLFSVMSPDRLPRDFISAFCSGASSPRNPHYALLFGMWSAFLAIITSPSSFAKVERRELNLGGGDFIIHAPLAGLSFRY